MGTRAQKKHGATMLEGLVDPDVFPAWLTPADLDYYVGEFTASGFFLPNKLQPAKARQPTTMIALAPRCTISPLWFGLAHVYPSA